MPTLQQAKSELLLRTVLMRGLKSLAPIYKTVTEAAEEMEDGIEEAHGVLVPVWHFLKQAEGVVKILEKKAGAPLPKVPKNTESNEADGKEIASKLSKALRSLSEWAEKQQRMLELLDHSISQQLVSLRDAAYQTASGLEDLMLPESGESRSDLLILEFKRLAGLPRGVK